jgi:hypothetical protein
MGNSSGKLSDDKINTVKSDLEEMYKQVLSSENIEKTIQGQYCSNLRIVVTNDVLKKYSNGILIDKSKEIILGYTEENNSDINKICDKLAEYYIKKVNLVGTIILSVRLAHLKLERIKSGGLCYGGDGKALNSSDKKFKIPVEPTIPFKIENNPGLILLDEDILKIRTETIKKVKATGVKIDENSLITNLAMIEINNPQECSRNGGRWLSTRHDAEKVYVIPTEDLKKENKKWFETMNKLENSIYTNIGLLVTILALLIDERVEPKMEDGVEKRNKIYRDRLIYDKDLDTQLIKTKKILIDLFIALDSLFLILLSLDVVGPEHIKIMNEMEQSLKELKGRGK